MRELRIQYQLRKKELLLVLLLLCGFYAAGMLLFAVLVQTGILGTEETAAVAYICWIFTAISSVGAYGLSMLFSFPRDFNMAISMGQTRKRFLLAWIAVTVLELFLAAVCFTALGFLQKAQVLRMLPELPRFAAAPDVLRIPYLALAALLLLAFILFCGALLLRFGTRVMWVLWIVFMLCCFLPANLSENEKAQQFFASTGLFSDGFFTGQGLTAAAVVLGIALILAALRMLGRQRVTA